MHTFCKGYSQIEQTQTDWSTLSAVWAKNKIISFIDGLTSQDRPRFSWKNLVNTDLYKKCFSLDLANHQTKWRNAIRPVIAADGPPPYYEWNKERKRPVSK